MFFNIDSRYNYFHCGKEELFDAACFEYVTFDSSES